MIIVKGGNCKTKGSMPEIWLELSCAIAAVLEHATNELGEETANEVLADVGRLALVAGDESSQTEFDELASNMIAKLAKAEAKKMFGKDADDILEFIDSIK